MVQSIFFLALLVFAVIAFNSYFVKNVLEKKQMYRIERDFQNYLEDNNNALQFAFFGDSHTKNDVDPQFIPGAFNLASGGESYTFSYFRLRAMLIEENLNLKSIILQTDPQSFSSRKYEDSTAFENIWFWKNFASYQELRQITKRSVIRLFFESNLPMVGSGGDIEILFQPNLISKTQKGWVPATGNFSDANRSKEALAYFRTDFKDQTHLISPMGLAYFKKMISVAQDKNVQIIFIKYPLSQDYIETLKEQGINQTSYYADLFTELNKTIRNYTVLDYQNLYGNRTDMFSDPSHLNVAGSQNFSKRLYEDLQKIQRNNKAN